MNITQVLLNNESVNTYMILNKNNYSSMNIGISLVITGYLNCRY